jgi:acyl dehydratase
VKTVEIDTPAGTSALLLGALRSSRKRPGTIAALPELTYVRQHVVLDPAHLARYATVCGFSAEHGVPIPYPQLLTFDLVMAFLGSADCPWSALGTVHLANRITQRQRLNPGDALRVEVSTGRLLAHEKGQVFTLEMKILRDGAIVWEATQSLLRIGVRNPTGPAYASELSTERPLSRQADFMAPGNIGRRYGRVSGDRNPIHLSALSARLFGFRRAIAHGLWTQARALAVLLPREVVAQAQVAVEFKTPLFLPARASLWATRDAAAPFARGALFEVRNAQGDKPHLRGRLSYP